MKLVSAAKLPVTGAPPASAENCPLVAGLDLLVSSPIRDSCMQAAREAQFSDYCIRLTAATSYKLEELRDSDGESFLLWNCLQE